MSLQNLHKILPDKMRSRFFAFKPFWVIWAIAMVLFVISSVTPDIPDTPVSNTKDNVSTATSRNITWKGYEFIPLENGVEIIKNNKKYLAKKKEDKINFFMFVGSERYAVDYKIKIKDGGFAVIRADEVEARFKYVDGKINVYDKTGTRLFKVKYKKGRYRYYEGDSSSYSFVSAADIYDAAISKSPIDFDMVKAYAYVYRKDLFVADD